jgi:hypothetical protein
MLRDWKVYARKYESVVFDNGQIRDRFLMEGKIGRSGNRRRQVA